MTTSSPMERANTSTARPCKVEGATINVSNTKGYLCHIFCETIFPCPPSVIFAILTNPDNAAVFRDLKATGYRKVLQEKQGFREVEVEQKGEIKMMWKLHQFSTFLTVQEDNRDPTSLMTSFTLIKSDILTRFQGTWKLMPVSAEDATKTRAVLEQDVLPAGVPEFAKRMPVISNILKGICERAVRRLLEDVEAVIKRINEGTPMDAILKPEGRSAAPISLGLASHRLDIDDHVDSFTEQPKALP